MTTARTNITSTNWRQFEQRLEVLGRLLGAKSVRFTGEGEPDGLWVFGDWQAFVYEAKTDEQVASGVSLNTVRQAASHEQTVRAQNRIPVYLPCSTVIVSPRTAIDSLAVPHAGGLFYLSHEEVIRLFDAAVQAFSHVRATAGSSSQEVLRDNFVKAYQERGLWLTDIKAVLQRTRPSNLPVK